MIVTKGRNLKDDETTICLTRYGNVVVSCGSVIPLFIDQVRYGKPITITDPILQKKFTMY